MDTCNVLIADDHELILQSIRDILVNKLGMKPERINMFTSPKQVLSTIQKTTYDLYILDLEFQKLSGFDLIKSIREKDRNAKIIVCTMHQEIWNINRLIEADVDGLILKKSANIHLEQAIHCVVKGEQFMCPKFEEAKQHSRSYRNGIRISHITDREKQVLELIAGGYSSKEIASRLGISVDGVEKHRKHLFEKLGVKNAAELVRVAICRRLIEPEGSSS